MLAAKVIHRLLQEQVPVLYFFFRQIVDANHKPRAALQDWLAQALTHSPPVQLRLKDYLGDLNWPSDRQRSSQPRELESVSDLDLWQHLRTALSHLSRAYIIVDALDEMDEGQDTDAFLHHLSDLADWKPSQVKILITSRPVASVERHLRKETLLRLRLDEEKVDRDISAYVQSRLDASTIPPEMCGPIQAAVPGKSKGLFLYAKLAMDDLLKEGVDIRTALREIPQNLHHMYTKLLNEHATRPGVSKELQLLMLQWITHSVRPLRLIEMSDMLTHEPTLGNRELGIAKGFVRSASGVLVELLPDETLCVVHHSITEFLKGYTRTDSKDYPILKPGPVHYRLALICLSYLQNGCLKDAEPELLVSRNPFDRTPKEPLLAPFTRYAALNWGTHVKRSSDHDMDQMEINIMLDKFTAHIHFQNWAHLAGLRTDATRTDTHHIITPLSMATLLGLSGYVEHLLARPDTDRNGGAPIAWAADKGFADIVDLLIHSGADVDQYDAEGYTALHRAAIKNHPNIVRALLEAGCDMNRATKIVPLDCGFPVDQPSALWYACNHGHIETVVEFQADMKTSKEIETALIVAVKYKRASIVQQLLKHPLVDLSKPRARLQLDQRNTLLNLACSNRDLDMIELLLAAGADVNTCALHALTRSKEATDTSSLMRCFTLLIEAGADLNMPELTQYHNTPLHQAADMTATKMLLDAGANVDAENKGKQTPLHTCSDVGVLTMLVKTGKADLEKTDCSGKTPLLAAMDTSLMGCKDAAVVIALVDLGANANAVDNEGNGIFHLAIRKYYGEFPEGLIARLCAAGADINRPNNRGEAPIDLTKIEISKASEVEHLRFPKKTTRFEVLVAAGARFAPTTASASRTPLFNLISTSICDASDTNRPEVLATLVQCGASLDITDDQGRTLLHSAARNTQHKAQIQFLLDQGLDPRATDYEGNTLWHEAASHLASAYYNLANGSAEPFGQLTQMDIDPTRSNYHGRTPLHVLSTLSPGSVYELKHFNHTTTFDVVLSLHPEVDIADEDGVTPLHAASTFSEYLVKRLLERGADPSRVTTEGCNAVHLAARSRMPNIVGLLLEALRSRSTTTLESAVRAKDHFGRAPLYYTCIAASYESAKLLVDAGAIVDSTDYESSPWQAIAGFEMEAKNWRDYSSDRTAGAVSMVDKRRPTGQGGHYYRQDRIDELITLLVANGAPGTTFMDQAIADAASLQADYTVECLLRARDSLELKENFIVTAHITASTNRRRIKRRDLEMPCTKCQEMHNVSPLRRARIMREYRPLFEMLLFEGRLQSLPNTEEGKLLLRDLVSNGFASILQHIMAVGGSQALDDRPWHVQSVTQNSFGTRRGQNREEPLLLSACRRDASNIDVIRVLVEQAGHDVNVQQHVEERTEAYYQSFSDVGKHVEGESTLHALVRGEYWWHVSQGLCYFLEHGADTELRDIHGMTPLSAALNRCGWLIFDKRAVELLVQYGADVNAVDRSGNSCLAKACPDMGMAKLLLDNGAVVTQSVLVEAIKLKDVDLLALLLSRGTDPNICGKTGRPGYTEIPSADRYPLHYLLSTMGRGYDRSKTASDRQKQQRMMKLLLDQGANPCARYDDTTILHELVRANEDISPLFMTPGLSLDLEARNASGETPLLLALQRTSSPDRTQQENAEGRGTMNLLISQGADIHAQDSHGNNILHSFAKRGGFGHGFEEFVRIVREAPELVNQPNNKGSTPLHIVMECVHYRRIIDLFLENSGNVHAVDIKGDSMLHLLLRGEWNINERGEVKGWLLHYFNRLLALGVDINLQNTAGETPIYSFFRHGKVRLESNSVQSSSLFGQPSSNSNSVQPSSLFGGLRGNSNSVQPSSLFGGFGQNSNSVQPSGLFGQPSSNSNSVQSSSLFGGLRETNIGGQFSSLFEQPTQQTLDTKASVGSSSVRPPGLLEQPVYDLFTKVGVHWQVINKKGQNLLHVIASTPPADASSPCEKFKTLVELGLDAGLEDETGRTPVDIAADLGHKDILDLFRER